MIRALRLFGAGACLVAFALLITLWLLSYSRSHNASLTYPTGRMGAIEGQPHAIFRMLSIETCRGQLGVSGGLNIPKDESVDRFPLFDLRSHAPPFTNAWWGCPSSRRNLGILFISFRPGWYGASAPIWLLTLLVGVTGLGLSLKPPYRFTIRGALVATTILGIVLAFRVAFN